MQSDTPGELRGELDFTLDPDGAIDAGRFLLDDGPEVPVVGQATGRAINLRADLRVFQEGLVLVLLGTAQEPLSRCRGAVDGLLTGPAIGDLGDWHATATAVGGGRSASVAPTPTPVRAAPTPTPAPARAQPCGPGLTRCSGRCVDLNVDMLNCGRCNNGCGGGDAPYICQGGQCVLVDGDFCAPGLTDCGGRCVDLNVDMLNCGRCNNGCGGGDAPYICQGGQCVLVDIGSCAPGLTHCGSACVDLSSDPLHCGGCVNACAPGESCVGGICEPSGPIPIACAPGFTLCGGICAELSSDPANCGACGVVCEADPGGATVSCAGGECLYTVTGPMACAPGFTLCGGICAELSSDPANCGACGVVCEADPGGATVSCAGGECLYTVTGPMACAPGFTLCGGICAELSSDPANCGACGVVCSPQAPSCIGGVCTL